MSQRLESEVDVVIPTWNCERWIDRCLEALALQTLAPARIVVVDDGSTDATLEILERWRSRIELVRRARRGGFAGAVTLGIERSDAAWFALLNADTEADPSWLERLVEAVAAGGDRCGSVASRMLRLAEPGIIDDAGDTFSYYGSAVKRGRGEPADRWEGAGSVLSASAGAALYRRAAFDLVGGFDLDFDSYLEDVDLGLRLQLAGFRCLYAPEAIVRHAGGGSGLSRSRYVRLVTANRAATVVKNFPVSLLLRHFPTLLWGQLYFLAAYRRPWQSLRGYLALVRRLPNLLKSRRTVQSTRRISAAELDAKLETSLGEPPLRKLIRRRIARS